MQSEQGKPASDPAGTVGSNQAVASDQHGPPGVPVEPVAAGGSGNDSNRQGGDDPAGADAYPDICYDHLTEAAKGAQPGDTKARAAWPNLWWALNQRKNKAGDSVPGGTITILSDGPTYILFVTLRQVQVSTTVRCDHLDLVWDAINAALASPNTIWKPTAARKGYIAPKAAK